MGVLMLLRTTESFSEGPDVYQRSLERGGIVNTDRKRGAIAGVIYALVSMVVVLGGLMGPVPHAVAATDPVLAAAVTLEQSGTTVSFSVSNIQFNMIIC